MRNLIRNANEATATQYDALLGFGQVDPGILTSQILDAVDLTGPCIILPVRHHSPACAWHVRRVISDVRPDAVLIEGPCDADPLIPPLLEDQTVPPIAIYAFVRDKDSDRSGSCFYPFCAYSPEYLALQTGRELDVETAFIDLPSYRAIEVRQPGTSRVNAYSDGDLRQHQYLLELCKATRMRGFDELWDHLFESAGPDRDSGDFFTQVATYCRIARQHADPIALEESGNTERESFMAAHIQARLRAGQKVVTVVGGFHRSGLIDRLNAPTRTRGKAIKTPKPRPKTEHGIYLTIYGYLQLDRWSGYQAGMPAPEFHHRSWESILAPSQSADSQLLQMLARSLSKGREPLSTADLITASTMLSGLSRIRGHARPTLDDVRDTARSCWIKGSSDGARSTVLSEVDRLLVGSRVGKVSPSAGRPPIVEDFYRQLRALKIVRSESDLGSMRDRQLLLDIYRQRPHRRRSALLHRLVEMQCGFASLIAGPDFVAGVELKRVREIWQINWKPEVEAAIAESSTFGSTIAEAAALRLVERIHQPGHAHDAATAVSCLTSALVMDLPELADGFLDKVQQALRTEAVFASSARAFSSLVHLLRYRTILGASRFPRITELVGVAYQRAVWLVDTLPGLPETATSPLGAASDAPTEDAMAGLILLRHGVLSNAIDTIDPTLYTQALKQIWPRLGRHPLLQGAVAGLLRQLGAMDDQQVQVAIEAAVDNTLASQETPLGDFLRGLFAARHHAITEETGLFQAVHRCLAELEEDRFLAALPSLRLAFTTFTPREIKRLVRLIENRQLGPASPPASPTEEERAMARMVDAVVRATLDRFHWPSTNPPTKPNE